MCRSIRTLRPPYAEQVTDDDVRAAALQYVRKVSGFRTPAGTNAAAFDHAVETVASATVGDAGAIAVRLAEEWRARRTNGDWKSELAARTDLPPDERIERTVFVKAPRSVRYGDVAKVIDAVKGAGAQPVGHETDELPD